MEGGGGGSRKGGTGGAEKDDTVPAAFFAGLKHEKDFSGMFNGLNQILTNIMIYVFAVL